MTTDRDEIEALRQRLHAIEVEREQLVARLRDLEWLISTVRGRPESLSLDLRKPITATAVVLLLPPDPARDWAPVLGKDPQAPRLSGQWIA